MSDAPNPPPVPPTLAEAIQALVNATTLIAQNQNNGGQRNHDRNPREGTSYVEFTDTRPPVFSRADEPLEVDDWLRTMEQNLNLSIAQSTKSQYLPPNSSGAQQEPSGQISLLLSPRGIE